MTLFFRFLLVAFVLLTFKHVTGRNATAPLDFSATSAAVAVLFDTDILRMETPIAVRYAFIFAVIGFNVAAPCEEAALNFWGEREALPAKVCKSTESIEDVNIYGILRSIELEFPDQAANYADLMRANGLDPDNRSTDRNTGIGFGNAAGTRVAKWFAKDGWNSLGDGTRDNYRQRFEDFSKYKPANMPNKVSRLPLRWQPLTQSRRFGRYASQVHVVPFLGSRDPVVLTKKNVQSRRAKMPYRRINSRRLGGSDARRLDGLISEVFEASAALTEKQRVLARWWDNKFISLGLIGATVFPLYNITDLFSQSKWLLGEMMAQHDAMIVAWKEKRRFDTVRPSTAVPLRFTGRKVRAYVPAKKTVMTVKAEEWEPLIPAQPHSEYPSASAVLCGASMEHSRVFVEEFVKARNGTLVEVPFTADLSNLGFDREGIKSVTFQTFDEAAKSCGISRLWAGVHFKPAIPAGEKLSVGIGRAAYEHVRDLASGKVPTPCTRCTRK